MQIWDALLDFFRSALSSLQDVFAAVPLIDALDAWGWAIIAVTIVVRLLLLPLAVKQTRSMRGMQALQPKIKELQKKHKVDRSLLRTDPQKYKARKQKMNEEMMGLYREAGVNPAAGCLPLLAQAPIFFALFRVLSDYQPLKEGQFYFFTGSEGLGASVSAVGLAGWLLVVMMAGSMFWAQRQMTGRMDGDAQSQQQKIIMYVMPAFLAVVAVNLPVGVLLYWVTTNIWQLGQQAYILRDVRAAGAGSGGEAVAPGGAAAGGSGNGKRGGSGSGSTGGGSGDGQRKGRKRLSKEDGSGAKGGAGKPASRRKPKGGGDHLPKRPK